MKLADLELVSRAKTDTVGVNNLLLHICCGPCAVYPLEQFLARGVRPIGLFYNPNIQPLVEWKRRLQSAKEVASHFGIALYVLPHLDATQIWSDRADDPKRCQFCYATRLHKTAQLAMTNGFARFGTTLKVSIYQDQEAIDEIGQKLGLKYGLEFDSTDFRPGFRQGQNEARELGLYRQKYCGCSCSLEASQFCDKIKRQHLALIAP